MINFAQGELATFLTYIAWSLTAKHGWRFWPAFVTILAFSFVGGALIQQHSSGRSRTAPCWAS